MNRHLKANIGLDYSFTFLNSLNLTHALWMIWLSLKGFSLLQLGILEGVFHITSFFMEVPTGAVADLYGRRNSRILGRLIFAVSLFVLWRADSFAAQMAGFMLTAVSYDLESGAGEALVYDSLLHIREEHRFQGVRGKKEFIIQLASVVALLLGGTLATRDYNLVFSLTIIIALMAAGNALLMKEPPMEKSPGSEREGTLLKRVVTSILEQSAMSLKVLQKEPRIAFLILYCEGIFVFVTTQYFYLQTWWKFAGYSEAYMGVVFAVQCLLAGLSALTAPVLEKKIGEKKLLVMIPLMLLFSLWGVAVFHFKALFFVLTGVFEGVLLVIVSDYINQMIPSAYRATILSYQSMTFSILMVLLFPFIGWLGDRFTLDLAFYAIAGIASVFLVLYGVYVRRTMPAGSNI